MPVPKCIPQQAFHSCQCHQRGALLGTYLPPPAGAFLMHGGMPACAAALSLPGPSVPPAWSHGVPARAAMLSLLGTPCLGSPRAAVPLVPGTRPPRFTSCLLVPPRLCCPGTPPPRPGLTAAFSWCASLWHCASNAEHPSPPQHEPAAAWDTAASSHGGQQLRWGCCLQTAGPGGRFELWGGGMWGSAHPDGIAMLMAAP